MKKKHKKKRRFTPKGTATIVVPKADWNGLIVRSKTLACLGLGSGTLCPKCEECLVVKEKCPGCGYRVRITED